MTSLEISESSQPGESVGGVQATDPDSTVVWLSINYPYHLKQLKSCKHSFHVCAWIYSVQFKGMSVIIFVFMLDLT